MKKKTVCSFVVAAWLAALGVGYADGNLDGVIGEPYGATVALDSAEDGICGFEGVEPACGRGDLLDFHALSWPSGDFGNQWYFAFTVDSSQPLDDQGSPTPAFFDDPCEQKINYLIGIDAGCDGAPWLGMWESGQPWQRNFDWQVDYFIALYPTGPQTMAGQLWQNDGAGNSRTYLADVLVVTRVIGLRRQIEIVLPDSPDIPEQLRESEPIGTMLVSVKDADGIDAGVYDWIGGAEDDSCVDFAEFSAEDMFCTAPNSKVSGRPTDPGDNDLYSLSLPRRDTFREITSELDCESASEEPIFMDGSPDPGRYTHLVESEFAGPYAGGSPTTSDLIGESSASTYYDSEGADLSTYSSGGDADIHNVFVATDPNYLYVLVEGPTALGWGGGADRANLYVAIDSPVRISNTGTGGNCDTVANAPNGRRVNFKGWDPDTVVEVVWGGEAVLWTSDTVGGWMQTAAAANEETSLDEVPVGFHFGGTVESYELAIPWSALGFKAPEYEPQNIKLAVYTTADENTEGRSDWDVFDQAPGVGQGGTGLGSHEQLGDDPGDSDCLNTASPLLSDYLAYAGATADFTAGPASDTDISQNIPGLSGNDIDTIEGYFTFNVYEIPLLCEAAGCVEDELPPEVTCPPQYVDECEIPPVALTMDDFDIQGGLAVDDCPGPLSIQHLGDTNLGGSGCEDDPLVILREYRIYDANGNHADCVQEINIVDYQSPELLVPEDLELSCDEDSDPEASGMAFANDNCIAPVITYEDEVEGTCPTIIYRTWTASDLCGHVISGVQTITIVDDIGPSLELPDDAEVEAGDDISPAVTGMASAFDTCSGELEPEYEDDIIPGDCAGTFIIERFWTVTDACGNENDGDQTITVVDTTPPVLMIPVNITIQCSDSTDPDFTGWAEALDAGDEGVEAYFEDEIVPGECDFAWTINRTWFAEDDCGNWESGLQVITVVDTTAPELEIPEDVTVSCIDSTDPEETGMALAEDNCDIVTATYSDEISGACPTIIVRTWTAVDSCGNEASGVQTITIADETEPDLVLPESVTVEFGSDTSVEALGAATASDLCNGELDVVSEDDFVPGDCAGSYAIVRIWSAVDACGNTAESEQVITVVDTTAPVLTVPADVTVECSEGVDPSVTGFAEADDAADEEPEVTYEDVITPGDCDNTYTVTRTWTAVDACGNEASAVQIITVVDTTAPDLTVPADLEVSCGSETAPEFTGLATATDACDIPNVTYADEVSGTCPTVITRTWTAVDACGNEASAVQVITVVDDGQPVLVVPAAVTIDGNGDADPAATGEATASDSCGDVTVSYTDVVSGGCPGEIVRTWTAVDACGNAVSDVQVITRTDTTAPVIICPADITVPCGSSSIDPSATGVATAEDDCDGVVEATYVDAAGDGVVVRTWTASDAAGNLASCDQVITLSGGDGGALQLIGCPEDLGLFTCDVVPAPAAVTAVDGCGNAVEVAFVETIDDGGDDRRGWGRKNRRDRRSDSHGPTVITRTWTATDADGASVSCTQVITIEGSGEIQLSGCPDDLRISACDDVPPPALVTAVDGCGNALTVTFSEERITDRDGRRDDRKRSKRKHCRNEADEVIVRTWTATDAEGNSAQCEQLITIDQGGNCVRTRAYWKNNPGDWPVSELEVGCELFGKNELKKMIRAPVKGDIKVILEQQLIAALLNLANGACPGDKALEVVDEAQSLLCDLHDDDRLSWSEKRAVLRATAGLVAFNTGNLGSRLCFGNDRDDD